MKNKALFRRVSALFIAAAITASVCGCSEAPSGSTYEPEDTSSSVSSEVLVQQADFDNVKEYDPSGATYSSFSGSAVTVDGPGCTIDGSKLTITQKGTYILSGTLEGQVIIDADGEKIRLVLDGVNITCPDSSPIYVRDAKKVTVTLADGSNNILTDGESYIYDDAAEEEPNAALFSKADLILEGSGSLTVNARFNNGIQSKDTLEIHGGTYTVNATNHGITGKDSLAIKDGTFTITAGGDGMRSNNNDEAELGWISVTGGSFVINAGQDGMQAETTLHIGGGDFSLTTGGGSINSSTENENWGSWGGGNFGGFGGGMGDRPEGGMGDRPEHPDGNMGERPEGGMGDRPERPDGDMAFPGSRSGNAVLYSTESSGSSAKAIKAGNDILIENVTISIDSSDDAIHSNGDLSIAGGVVSISSGDDGIHADAAMNISGGQVTIAKSLEGIEGVSVNISGGSIDLTASDDGINSAGGNDGGSDRPGANNFAYDNNCDITISGGTIIADASGDGIDSNGDINISGGTLMLSGPTNSGNGPFDYAGELVVTGGRVAVAGSAGMAQGASRSSTQANLLLCFNVTVPGGTLLSLTDASGEVVFAVAPKKDYSSVFASVPSMSVGDEYTLWLGGTCSGESADGIYTGGTLSGAEQITGVTISEVSTYYGGYSGMGGPGR